MTRIKLCGMRRLEDIEVVNELKPDYVGFIFVQKSRRYVRPDQAKQLIQHLAPSIKAVGVFVNDMDAQAVVDIARSCGLGAVQLHKDKDDARVDAIHTLTVKDPKPLTIIRAFSIASAEDVDPVEKSHADLVLVDHGGGGTGESFDWSLIQNLKRDFFLAGGLTPENVGEAIRLTKPLAVDASSSLETDGFKDPQKMRAFVQAVHDTDRELARGERSKYI